MTFRLRLSATAESSRAVATPRGAVRPLTRRVHTPRTPRSKTPRSHLQAIQTPVSLSSLQLVPSRDEVHDLEGSEAIVVELRTQLEEIWHEYASARKRNLALQEENEGLQSRVKRLEAEVAQEKYHRRDAQAKLLQLEEQCNP